MRDLPENNKRIALVAMPWSVFNRPSIQLATLKSYTEANSRVKVDCFHPYLQLASQIGTDRYQDIALNGWAGEAIFSALLFPDQAPKAEKLFLDSLDRTHFQAFPLLTKQVRKICSEWMHSIDWESYLAVGFSLCFNQLLPSLYIANEFKKRFPSIPIIFGGSSCSGPLGSSLLRNFKQVDYVISGEGEIPFLQLANHLAQPSAPFPDRVISRTPQTDIIPTPEIADLSSLPIPDYSHYFSELKEHFRDAPFIPEIPLEFSRGCWWNKCTFCNLNLQWHKYRWKKTGRLLEELKSFVNTHHCLDFCFTDNALPPKEAESFFQTLHHSTVDLNFFAEIRAITSAKNLQLYSKAGLRSIQVGIESLSSSLLKKMEKGVTVIENIAIMKNAVQAGILLDGNLIVEFPDSTREEVEETLHVLDYVLPYNPLSIATFFLGHGSPVHNYPDKFGLSGFIQHKKNRALFPDSVLANLQLLTTEYRGDRTFQRKNWRDVRQKVQQWNVFHKSRKSQHKSPLSFRDGGTFIIIRQEKLEGPVLHHRLTGLSRELYLFLQDIRNVNEICARFPSLKQSAIEVFINQLCEKRIMFREGDKALSLAVHQNQSGPNICT